MALAWDSSEALLHENERLQEQLDCLERQAARAQAELQRSRRVSEELIDSELEARAANEELHRQLREAQRSHDRAEAAMELAQRCEGKVQELEARVEAQDDVAGGERRLMRRFLRQLEAVRPAHAAADDDLSEARREMRGLLCKERRLREEADEWLEDMDEAHGNRVRELERRLTSLEASCAAEAREEMSGIAHKECGLQEEAAEWLQDMDGAHVNRELELRLQSLESFRAEMQLEFAALAALPEVPRAPQKEGQAEQRSGSQDTECPAQQDPTCPARQDVLQRCRSIAADNQRLLRALRASRENWDRKVQAPFLPLCSGATSTASGGSGHSTPTESSPRASEAPGPSAFCA